MTPALYSLCPFAAPEKGELLSFHSSRFHPRHSESAPVSFFFFFSRNYGHKWQTRERESPCARPPKKWKREKGSYVPHSLLESTEKRATLLFKEKVFSMHSSSNFVRGVRTLKFSFSSPFQPQCPSKGGGEASLRGA